MADTASPAAGSMALSAPAQGQIPAKGADLGGDGTNAVEAQQADEAEADRAAAADSRRVAGAQADAGEGVIGDAQRIAADQDPLVEGKVVW
jgi:hypothetical protein